jgi:hypothetical protein
MCGGIPEAKSTGTVMIPPPPAMLSTNPAKKAAKKNIR